VNQILLGDCLDVLKTLPDESVHSVVTDPPYGLGTREPTADEIIAYLQGGELDTSGDFMGRDWSIPPVAVWRECFRVLKPGGHLVSFGGTRTFDLISIGIRAAGFECRDTIASQFGVQCFQWLNGSGFPKALSVQKALEKAGLSAAEAAAWEGWATALKPSWEPALIFRKPLAEATVAKQALATGTGAMNIDACRVGTTTRTNASSRQGTREGRGGYGLLSGTETVIHNHGRWPANLLLTHSEHCRQVGSKKVPAPVINRFDDGMKPFGDGAGHRYTSEQTGDADGMEEVTVYECEPGCPVKTLDEQSGTLSTHGGPVTSDMAAMGFNGGLGSSREILPSKGGASRFFGQFEPDAPFIYCPKVSKAERDHGLPKGTNRHPTVKPLAIMRWLVKLVTPKNVFVCPVCDGHNQSMRGMHDTVSAKAERFEGLLDQVSEQNCGQGRTQESSETVPDLSPGLQLPAQAPDVLQPQMQGAGGSRGARKKVRELRKTIPSEQPEPGAQEKVLLESLRLQITDEESGTQALSGLSNAIHPEGSEDVSTTTTLLSEVRGGNSLSQTTTQNHVDESWVSNALSAGAPHGDKTRDAVGTPPGNGGAPGADAAAVGGSSSPERDQRRQQNRESPGAAETRARSSAASIDVPSLSGRDSNPRTCPRCGSGLISAPGVVLDPYCGSGSTLVAAMSEGFNFIGIERDPESHAVAVLRTTRKPDVFDTLEELA
jgi:site-specific DNA-methyltransferase (adenine-specific)